MIDQWDELIIWSTFEVSIALAKVYVDMHFALNRSHGRNATNSDEGKEAAIDADRDWGISMICCFLSLYLTCNKRDQVV